MIQHGVITIGLSGGVDSAVAAALLLEQGHTVTAVFLKCFSDPENLEECPWREDYESAIRVAKHLQIPLDIWDLQAEYKAKVLNYMYAEYKQGRTPNPDIMCNTEIKFNVMLERAMKQGSALLATGHYAKVLKRAGTYRLLKGKDTNKDQSYFLSGLNQKKLSHLIFPLADITKADVRKIAAKYNLPNAQRKDSQGLCFVGKVDIADFLQKKIKPRNGDIVDTAGNKLGEHQGVYYYTIGQRQGINIGGGPALYVIDKDIHNNRLIVGTASDPMLMKTKLTASQWHWLAQEYELPLKAKAKIRYRQKDQAVILSELMNNKVSAIFSEKQRAIAPGQTIAAYKGRELIGSGIIV